MEKNGKPQFPPGANPKKYFQKTIDKSLLVCYNKDTEREVIQMEKIYQLVKCWYDRDVLYDHEWQEFCELMLQILMEDNKEVLKRLKENA